MEFKTILVWVLLLVFVAPGFIFGWLKIAATPEKIEQFKRLGIAIPLMRLLGVAEIAANLALLWPTTRLWGLAAWLVILLGANYYNLTRREPREELYASAGWLVFWGVVLWLSI